MGVGMVVVCAPERVRRVQASIAETTWVIGELRTDRRAPQRKSGVDTSIGEQPERPSRTAVGGAGSGQRIQPAGGQSLAHACTVIDAGCRGCVSNKARCSALQRADAARLYPRSHWTCEARPADYDARLSRAGRRFDPDLVVLAGWLRILTMSFLGWFPGRVVNLHPALPGETAGTARNRAGLGRSGLRAIEPSRE